MSERVVTITDQTIVGLLKNAAVIAASPALATYAKQLNGIKGCGCSGKSAAVRRAAVTGTKAVIAASESVRSIVKSQLKAGRIRMYVQKKLVEY